MAGQSKLGAIQKAILQSLEPGVDISLSFLLSHGSTAALFKNYRKRQRNRMLTRAKQSISALKRRRLISLREKDGETYLSVSEDNDKRFLKYKFEVLYLKEEKDWNGKWHMVMFDIPETFGKARRALTRKIKEIGAFPLQKSVFVFPFPWRDEINFITEFFHVSPFVRYVEATSIEREKELRQHFSL